MPDLNFQIEGAEAVAFAAAPTLSLKIRIDNATHEPIQAVLLRCQVQIEAPRRRYADEEQRRLAEVFGEQDLWDRSLRSLLWSQSQINVPAFSGHVVVELLVPCLPDPTGAAIHYFQGLTAGEVPLRVLLSGTVFYTSASGMLQVVQIPWDKDASWRMPLELWQQTVARYQAGPALVSVSREMADRLAEYQARTHSQDLEQALRRLLDHASEHEAAFVAKT